MPISLVRSFALLRSLQGPLLAVLGLWAAPPSLRAAVDPILTPQEEPWKQTEKDWQDSRWNRTDVGSFLASTLPAPNGMIAKGLSIRVGDQGQASVGYDTASAALRFAWTGGFLNYPTVRFGINGAPVPAGPILFTTPSTNAWLGGETHWDGFHVHGKHLVLRYHVGTTEILETPWVEEGEGMLAIRRSFQVGPHSGRLELPVQSLMEANTAHSEVIGSVRAATLDGKKGAILTTALGPVELHAAAETYGRITLRLPPSSKTETIQLIQWGGGSDRLGEVKAWASKRPAAPFPADLLKPGTARWPALTTQGQMSTAPKSQAYVVDTFTVPYENPWNALMFTSGVDFLPNGDAAVCTLHGDVWVVSGLDNPGLRNLRWKRAATGLFQPLGLRVVHGAIHVLGRDQITRLEDTNGDGEADDYHCFSNLIPTSTGSHDYVTSLEVDAANQFYFIDPLGIHRISADGREIKTLATGWRNPNGMSVGPDGTITAAPQQGTWTPSSQISEVKVGGYYGFGGPKVTPQTPLGYEPPLCWIPHPVDNSTGSQVWSPADRWGPLGGQLLSLSFGRCALYLVLRDKVDGQPQGGVVPLKVRFISGSMRGTFRKQDGQLYVVGSQGWQTAGPRDGCLQRVRYTGAPYDEIIGLRCHKDGIRLTFTRPLERSAAEDVGSYGLEQWNYRYSSQYGSKEYSVKNPQAEGHDEVRVAAASLSQDGRTVTLRIPDLGPVMQMRIRYSLSAADGKAFRGDLYHTIHALHP